MKAIPKKCLHVQLMSLLSDLHCRSFSFQLPCWNTRIMSWTSVSSTARHILTGCPTSWTSSRGLCRLSERKVRDCSVIKRKCVAFFFLSFVWVTSGRSAEIRHLSLFNYDQGFVLFKNNNNHHIACNVAVFPELQNTAAVMWLKVMS